ncbi:hypothetical protein H2O64_19825 [Kordia sp. YSTF-M3]|uniref:Uncharacterized protein n=1 Tax=Kordia aestuariivivens TaxID=2759037 RepID=A0ABR7QED6_9FLAO|nr:hypothetical protein [Kordia aestuariivivens]MBC8756931.1 hypothetical protein [Kordia aestuariivivens]
MKQNIKNTLYRFVTMRAPELIGDEEKELGFVQYPDYSPSAFIAPASQATTETERKQAIATAVGSYSAHFNTVIELKTDLSGFYEFVKWFNANKKTLTVTEADAKIASGPFAYDITEIWDDLHYNILTNGDPYLRDLLLSFIVASFFIDSATNVDTDEAYRKLACAKVIIDKSLFTNEVATVTTDKNAPISEKNLKRETDAFMAQEYNKELKKIAKEVEKASKKHRRENQKSRDAYQKTYDVAVKAAYGAATIVERVVTDPDTGETSVVKEYQNLTIPEYTFIETDQLDKTVLASTISNEAVNYITEVQTEHGITTLDEVNAVLSDEILTNTATTFDNIDFGTTQVVTVGGTTVPVSTTPSNPFSFRVCSRKSAGSSQYVVGITLSMPNASYSVANMLYTMHFANESSNTNGSFAEAKTDNSIFLKLYGGLIDLDEPVSEFSGTITFTNGDTYDFTVPDLVKGQCFNGKLTASIDSGGNPIAEVPVVYGVQRLGIADYRKVEQEVCCYVPGEVSHIENIMAREYKSKDTKRTRRQETTDTFSSETERENLTETTSTDRFEMNQEIASMTAQDQSMNASAGVRWGTPGGSFGGNASASFANNTSSETSESQAITHAKELTERALDRVVQKVREERVTKVIEEYEENTSHGFDNRKGDKHISGVYRWVDKVYRNQILNYGKRLMYEFMIPEPASFHELAIELSSGEDILVEPVDPRTASVESMPNHEAVDEATYTHWAAIYNADVNPIPLNKVSVTKAYSKDDMAINDGRWAHAGDESVEIPENYYAESYSGYFTLKQGNHSGTWVRHGDIVVGGNKHSFNQVDNKQINGSFSNNKVIESLEFSVTSWDVGAYAFNLRVDCELRPEAKEAWQIETFNTIIEAYEERLAEYKEKYAAQQEKQKEAITINPGFYREIEKTVLRKNCITYLLGHENIGKNMINNRDSLTGITANYTNVALNNYAAQVKFFEQAFEWDIMSYNFYPFYWANKEKWGELYQVKNNDPLFRAFLQSGMARVIITVRPGFEEMVNWYMATGQIWNGGQVPTLDDEEFVSIVEELRNPESEVEETWETRVPTSLTVIQAGAIGLNVDGLPCDTDCDDWLQFDSDGNPVLDADGNPISDNPIVPIDDLIGGDNSEGVGSDTVSPIIVQ